MPKCPPVDHQAMDKDVRDSSAVDRHFPDEIPRFSLSPGRSISPIDFLHELDTCLRDDDHDENDADDAAEEELDHLCQPLSLNFVSLSEIDAQITPLKAKGLQTIFEGVFLETPPRSGGRTVIPRRTCDPQSTDSSSSDDEDDHVTPLPQSYRDDEGEMEEALLEGTEIIVARRRTRGSSIVQEQLMVASISSATGAAAAAASVTASFCNSFQRRLNLIPGEE